MYPFGFLGNWRFGAGALLFCLVSIGLQPLLLIFCQNRFWVLLIFLLAAVYVFVEVGFGCLVRGCRVGGMVQVASGTGFRLC